MNYFHMPWMTRSRAYASLKRYENRHTASVVLGVKTVTADKLIQRRKSNLTAKVLAGRASVWLKSVAGAPTQTPGAAVVIRHDGSPRLHSGSIRAQLIDRVLRDLQKGLSPVKAAMAHGLNAVSYTHLDVYKRQALWRPEFRFADRQRRLAGQLCHQRALPALCAPDL